MAVKDISEPVQLRQMIAVGERRQAERREHAAKLNELIEAREHTLQTYRNRLAAIECPSPFADAVVAAVNGNQQPTIAVGRRRINDHVGPPKWEVTTTTPVHDGDQLTILGGTFQHAAIARVVDGKLGAYYADNNQFCAFIKEEN